MTRLADYGDVLTVEEAAQVLRIGRSKAYDAARSGQIPTLRVGRCLRVPKYRLAQMLESVNANGPVDAGPLKKDHHDDHAKGQRQF
jgi:excisionase family DNA binding protein